MMEKLSQNINKNEEEKFMNEKYYKLKERLNFLEQYPDFKNEVKELLYDETELLIILIKIQKKL